MPIASAQTPDALRREVARLEARGAELEARRDAAVQLFQGDPQRNTEPLLEQIPAMVWVVDRELRLTWWTGGAIQALKADRHALIGVDMFNYLGTDETRTPNSSTPSARAAWAMRWPKSWPKSRRSRLRPPTPTEEERR